MRPKGASRRIKKPSGVSPWFFIAFTKRPARRRTASVAGSLLGFAPPVGRGEKTAEEVKARRRSGPKILAGRRREGR